MSGFENEEPLRLSVNAPQNMIAHGTGTVDAWDFVHTGLVITLAATAQWLIFALALQRSAALTVVGALLGAVTGALDGLSQRLSSPVSPRLLSRVV